MKSILFALAATATLVAGVVRGNEMEQREQGNFGKLDHVFLL
jgi:hypothetical protein